jgi:hypothetical protein
MELPESAGMKPPKRGINLFGGLLDIYTDYAGNSLIVVWP